MTAETNDDLARRLDRIERDMADMSNRLGRLEVQGSADDVHRVNIENRLANIESMLSWISRLLIGAILLPLIAFALSGGMTNIGG